MKKAALALLATAALLGTAVDAQAWSQEVHRRIAMDAVNYMKTHPTTTNYAKLLAGATAAGYTIDQFAAALGQGAYDVDDFADTYICGASTGSCQLAPVWGAGASIVKYTSYWHFQNQTRGPDVHGNDFGGYNYHLLTVWGDIDNMAASWLYGDYLDDGKGNLKGWFGDSTKYNAYDNTEAHYRMGGYSTRSQYADFETMPFEPIDNLGQYWFQQFLASPTVQSLGFVLHTTDLLQPHHTWTTSALNHAGWETWVNDYYYTYTLNDPALVTTALNDFTPMATTATDVRPLLTQGGAISYSQGGIVLSSTDDNDRKNVAKIMIPHAIAMAVRVLNRAAERF
ncbi:MAG: phospholipase [bacterium]|nr:phospholipase [bacterium]